MEISEKEIEAIVRSVLSGLGQKDFQAGALHVNDRTCSNGQDGILNRLRMPLKRPEQHKRNGYIDINWKTEKNH